MVIRGLVFDIDDTLFDERTYVRSGFVHAARVAGRSEAERKALSDWLWSAFESGIRGDTFDRLLEAFPDVAATVTSHDLIVAYRSHAPEIKLAAEMVELLNAIRQRGIKLGALSDGPAISQSAKVRALGLDHWFAPIVLTGALGPEFAKPATIGFQRIADAWGVHASTIGYVADNPEKDFAGPRRLGWTTFRLRRPAQLRFDIEPVDDSSRPDIEIRTPGELIAWLDQQQRQA